MTISIFSSNLNSKWEILIVLAKVCGVSLATIFPPLIKITRLQTSSTSAMLCEVKTIEIPELLRKLLDEKLSYSEISIEKPTLEDFFLQNLKTGEMK